MQLPGPQNHLESSYSRLNGIKPCHLHLQQAVFPVIQGHPRVVNAARDVSERFPILDKAVGIIINPKAPLRYILYTHTRKKKRRQYNFFSALKDTENRLYNVCGLSAIEDTMALKEEMVNDFPPAIYRPPES